MSVADNLNRIIQAKSDIKTAIEKKGVNVGNITIDKYAEKINLIEQGGGSAEKMKIKEGICLSGSTFTTFDGSEWDWSNVHDLSYMFQGCKNLTSAPTGLNIKPSTMLYAFSGCTAMQDVNALGDVDMSENEVLSDIFNGCTNLSDISALANWDVSNVKQINGVFVACKSLPDLYPISNWNVSNVQKIGGMFAESNITNTDAIKYWHTPKLVDMDQVFRACKDLTRVDLSGWDVSNVTVMSALFSGCNNLTSVDFGGWDTSKVTTMRDMFSNCKNLTNVDLSGWDTSKVTNMNNMFNGCTYLTDITGMVNWDTSNVTSMNAMFQYCQHLTSIDMSNWDISNVTSMGSMFYGCRELKEIKMGGPLNKALGITMIFSMIGLEGTFYYPKEHDYTKLINALPGGWTAVAY